MITKDIETLARQLCDERWGDGSYDQPRRNRTYWRREAKKMLQLMAKQWHDERDARHYFED